MTIKALYQVRFNVRDLDAQDRAKHPLWAHNRIRTVVGPPTARRAQIVVNDPKKNRADSTSNRGSQRHRMQLGLTYSAKCAGEH